MSASLLNSEMVLQLLDRDLDKVDIVVEFKASDKIPTDEKYYEDFKRKFLNSWLDSWLETNLPTIESFYNKLQNAY